MKRTRLTTSRKNTSACTERFLIRFERLVALKKTSERVKAERWRHHAHSYVKLVDFEDHDYNWPVLLTHADWGYNEFVKDSRKSWIDVIFKNFSTFNRECFHNIPHDIHEDDDGYTIERIEKICETYGYDCEYWSDPNTFLINFNETHGGGDYIPNPYSEIRIREKDNEN